LQKIQLENHTKLLKKLSIYCHIQERILIPIDPKHARGRSLHAMSMMLLSMTGQRGGELHRPIHYILDAVPPVNVVSNHVDNDKLTTANGGTFTSS